MDNLQACQTCFYRPTSARPNVRLSPHMLTCRAPSLPSRSSGEQRGVGDVVLSCFLLSLTDVEPRKSCFARREIMPRKRPRGPPTTADASTPPVEEVVSGNPLPSRLTTAGGTADVPPLKMPKRGPVWTFRRKLASKTIILNRALLPVSSLLHLFDCPSLTLSFRTFLDTLVGRVDLASNFIW